jgi:hypothetical protein
MDDFKIDSIKNQGADATTTTPHLSKLHFYNTKKHNIIKAFIYAGDHGINCFEAVKLHDYVLRTTVSDLQKSTGLKFSRKWESVPNAFGKKTECVRYWLDDDNVLKAKSILGRVNETEVMS